jgi:hypothetical protein
MFRHESGSNTLMSFLLGGLTGASLAVLLAPQSGEETRGRIRTRGRDLARRGRELAARPAVRGRDVAPPLGIPATLPTAPAGAAALPEPAVTPPPHGREGSA